MAETGLVFDNTYLEHLEGLSGHPETPERLRWIGKGLKESGLIEQMRRIPPRVAGPAELKLVHEREYLELVEREAAGLESISELSTGTLLFSPFAGCGVADHRRCPGCNGRSHTGGGWRMPFAPCGRPGIMPPPAARWDSASLIT